MFIEFDLNRNDFDALMRHCQTHRPSTGDAREDQRLLDALEALLHSKKISVDGTCGGDLQVLVRLKFVA